MKADHLMPDKYMKNDKDLMLEELKVRAQPLPSVITVWHMHGWGIASQNVMPQCATMGTLGIGTHMHTCMIAQN